MTDKAGTYLSQKEVARLLDLPEATVQRWISQGKIPTKSVRNKTVLKKSEIISWARAHDLDIKQNQDVQIIKSEDLFSLASALEKGGIYKGIEAHDAPSAFENALSRVGFLENEDKKLILKELLNREKMASTGIGNGVAIPHTRSRLQLNLQSAHIPVVFLKTPIPFNAVDNTSVHVLFLLFTTDVKEHLKMLAKLGFMLREEKVLDILKSENINNDLIDVIKAIENAAR